VLLFGYRERVFSRRADHHRSHGGGHGGDGDDAGCGTPWPGKRSRGPAV